MDVDMTPLIDVVFLLLTFFMVIHTIAQTERAAKLELPEAFQAVIQGQAPQGAVTINIEADGSIKMYGRLVSLDQLKSQLERIGPLLTELGETGEPPVEVRGDKACPYKYMSPVITAIYEAGIEKVDFSAYPAEPKEDVR